MEMVCENLATAPKEAEALVKWIRENVLANYRNPITKKYVELSADLLNITPEELHDPTGYIASR